jgi:cytochrome oxidase assembly protein ShyY1
MNIQAYTVGVDQLVVFSVLAPWQIERAAVENKRTASSVRVNELDVGGHMD